MGRGAKNGRKKINRVVSTLFRKLAKKYYSDEMPLLHLRNLNHI